MEGRGAAARGEMCKRSSAAPASAHCQAVNQHHQLLLALRPPPLMLRQRFEAIAYAKQHLECFSATELPEIRKLLGALVYIKRLAQSRYGHLQDDSHWVEVADLSVSLALSLSPFSSFIASLSLSFLHFSLSLSLSFHLFEVAELSVGPGLISSGPLHFTCHTSRQCSAVQRSPE